MNLRELKCIKQRLFMPTLEPDDGKALVREVERLRGVLAEVLDMTGDPAIITTINEALREGEG